MEASNQGGWSQEARCALHPEYMAGSTCGRCGSFMCEQCSAWGAQGLCPSCRERLGVDADFPLQRGTWTFSALWDLCWSTFQRHWLMLSVGTLIFFSTVVGAQFVSTLLGMLAQIVGSTGLIVAAYLLSSLLQYAVQGAVLMGLSRMLFDALAGRPPDIRVLFSQLHKVGRYVVALLLVLLAAAVLVAVLAVALVVVVAVLSGDSPRQLFGAGDGSSLQGSELELGLLFLLLLVPLLIYFTLPLTFLQLELVWNDDATATQALRACFTLARGQRLYILGVLMVCGLVTLAGMLVLCVGVLPGYALNLLLLTGLYRALRRGSELEPA